MAMHKLNKDSEVFEKHIDTARVSREAYPERQAIMNN
jgi:hypothetical protein